MIESVQSQHLYLQQKNKLMSDMLYKFYDEGELTEVDTNIDNVIEHKNVIISGKLIEMKNLR